MAVFDGTITSNQDSFIGSTYSDGLMRNLSESIASP